MKILRGVLVVSGLMGVVACGGPNAPTPRPSTPTLSCPAPAAVPSPDNVPMLVNFPIPTASGGQAPVSVTCSSQPGTTFPLGNTVVTCTATDALQRTASCNFNVAVTPTPRISKTNFLAFGDSITYGRCYTSPQECPPYTVRLRELLTERYARQTFVITNVGIPGEIASDDIAEPLGRLAGQDRIASEISRHSPEVVLLMEGVNDLLNASDRPTFAVDAAAIALDRMVEHAQQSGKTVFLATVSPIRYPAPPGTPNRNASGPLVPVLNERIRAIAAHRGVVLVDIYAAMSADLAGTISTDNLHPTELGIRVMADTFYASVRAALDVTPASSLTRR